MSALKQQMLSASEVSVRFGTGGHGMQASRQQTLHTFTNHGVTWVDAVADAKYRKALMDGCPLPVRARMREALAATPPKTARAHSLRYFGPEIDAIIAQVSPLVDELAWFLHHDKNLPDLKRWLQATGYGDDYRMIKAMVAWAEHMRSVPESEKLKWPVH